MNSISFEDFVTKAKQLVIEKRITGKNVKEIWLKDIYKIGYADEYLQEIEKMQPMGIGWTKKKIEHHKKQILKD